MSSKLFKQFINTKLSEENKKKSSLLKENNLTSSRRKLTASNTELKTYNRNITENNYLLKNINSFILKSNSSKKKKKIYNAKKILYKDIYNSKRNIFHKKLAISKKEMIKIINHNLSNSKQGKNLSIISVRSENEEKNKYEEKYINKLSYELILPSNNENENINLENSHKKTTNRNILPSLEDRMTNMTFSNNFSMSKIINNKDDNKEVIKVNLNENKKPKKIIIKKDISYAISNSNTNSNTNSRNITNYFNDNKINKNVISDITNFNKDIKEILNIKESIALLKERLKEDNNLCNKTYMNKVKSNKNKINYHPLNFTRNEMRNNYLNKNQTQLKTQINKTNNIKIESTDNKKKIHKNNSNKTKLNTNNNLYISKGSKRSSLSGKKIYDNTNKTLKNYFSQRKSQNKYSTNNNSNKNITNINKNRNGKSSEKTNTGMYNKNISNIIKYNRKKSFEKINNLSSYLNKKDNSNYKIKKYSKKEFLNISENKLYSNKIINQNQKLDKIVLVNKIKNISGINSLSIKEIKIPNKYICKNKNNLKIKFYKNRISNSLDIKLKNENNIKIIKPNKSQFIYSSFKKKNKEKLDTDIKKTIYKIEFISKAGEMIFGKRKINQDNYFCHDLMNNYKFIGVCDGHGEYGHNVSEFIKNTLPIELNNRLKQILTFKNILSSFSENDVKDKNLEYKQLKELLNYSHIVTNNKLLSKNNNNNFNLKLSGSTCISILMNIKNLNKLYISNIGDSRAIIIKEMKNKYWTCHQLSRDHKPIEKDESSRIYKSGGEIQKLEDEYGGWTGPLRVWAKNGIGPGLAMTRSFGDILGSTIGVISIPEINEYKLQKEDRAIIIASDGLWEYVSNKETINIVKKAINSNEPNKIVNKLYRESYKKWKNKEKGIDDVTIICIILKNII